MAGNFPVSCSCPITKSLQVSFTGSDPAPANGYIVKWRRANSSDAYTQVYPNPTSSPVTIAGVPACEDIEVVMQSQCANSEVSAEQTITASAMTASVCGANLSGSHTHNGAYQYPFYLLDVRGASSTISLNYDVVDKPNRFSVYDSSGNLVVTSGWKGTASYAGPWGASLSTLSSGLLTFTKAADACFYKLVVDSVTDTSYQDAWTMAFTCPITGDPEPTIELISCGNGYGSYRVNAPSGTTMKIALTATGYLTNNSVNPSQNCARIQGTISSSTGPSDSENSSPVSGTAMASIGTSNTLFVDVVVPGAGYLVINTSVYTVNSLSSTTSATLKIIDVNGVTKNITQPVCVYNSTGTVSCTTTYQNYNATKYSCSTCSPVSGEGAVLVALPTGVTGVLQQFYVPEVGSGEVGLFTYLLESLSSNGPGLTLQDVHYATCAQACAIGSGGS